MASQSKSTRTRAEPGTDGRPTAAGSSRVVAERSRVGFRVKKMGLYYVKGRFGGVEGRIETAPDGSFESGDLRIDARTISTRMPPRDWHLRSADFLEVETYPEIRVSAERVDALRDGEFRVMAVFELHGQRRPAELTGHLHAGPPPVLHLQGRLDRHNFGIRARQPFELIVGREVGLDVELALEAPG